jgi:hypothetical protein
MTTKPVATRPEGSAPFVATAMRRASRKVLAKLRSILEAA